MLKPGDKVQVTEHQAAVIDAFAKAFEGIIDWTRQLAPLFRQIVRMGAIATHAERHRLGIGPAQMARRYHMSTREYRRFERNRLGTARPHQVNNTSTSSARR